MNKIQTDRLREKQTDRQMNIKTDAMNGQTHSV